MIPRLTFLLTLLLLCFFIDGCSGPAYSVRKDYVRVEGFYSCAPGTMLMRLSLCEEPKGEPCYEVHKSCEVAP